jgi:hypothetical protein
MILPGELDSEVARLQPDQRTAMVRLCVETKGIEIQQEVVPWL